MNKIRLIPPKLRKSSLSKPLWQLIRPYALCAVLLSLCQVMIQAQISTIVFEDDFSSNAIDPATYEQATPFFEGGEGDIHAEAGDGVTKRPLDFQ